MIDQRDCTVCLEPYESEQIIMGLACGHNYHQPCIAQWLCRGNHRCPICRWPSYRLQHPRQYQYQKNQQQQQQQMLFKHNQYHTALNDIS
uniref:E3 ubiquitin-protein ligase RNF103-like n=1 Tax=Dermatophagoides pteronyssinus TaxID=6956 RepID=A0A6P6XQR1_DERPT|nr:E3 ubiquitin-protein ligase RNF103-like [Dermatophagoides pteronyssinus]